MNDNNRPPFTHRADVLYHPAVKGGGNGVGPERLLLKDVGALQGVPIPERRWLVEGRIPSGAVTLLNGDGGVGKTIIALQLCVRTVIGTDWLGALIERNGNALFYSGEETDDELHRRLALIVEHYGIEFADLAGRFFTHCCATEDPLLARLDKDRTTVVPTPAFAQLQQAVADIKPEVVVMETASDVFGGSEIDRAQVRKFLGMLRGLARGKGIGDRMCAVVLLQHPSLSGMQSGKVMSGSTAWNNSVRSRIAMKKADEDAEIDNNLRTLEVMKANYGPTGAVTPLRWRDGVFVVEGGKSIEALARGARAENTFMLLLKRFTDQGQHLSVNSGKSYAPARFAAHDEAGTLTSADFAMAMQRLLDAGHIHIATVRLDGKPKQVLMPGRVTPNE